MHSGCGAKDMRYPGIEIGRVIGLLGVIIIHAATVFGPRQDLAFIASELARFSVPLFFMASGFFWKPEHVAHPLPAIRRLAFRVLLPFAVFVVLYLLVDRWSLFYPRSYFGSIRSYLLFPLSGGIGYHLWFLPALFIGTAITLAGIRFLGLHRAFALSALAYLAGCLLFYFSHIAGWRIGEIFYRNGLLFAPLFLMIGHCCRVFDWPRHLPASAASCILAVGAGLHMSEGYFFSYPSGHDMSLATVPFAFGAFLIFARFSTAPASLANWGRDVFYGYLIHLMALRMIRHALPIEGSLAAMIIVSATFMLSLLLARSYRMARSRFVAGHASIPPAPT